MKKLENHISFSIYKHAPESFKLFFRKQEIKLSQDKASEFGYILMTQGKEKLLQELKRFIRRDSAISKNEGTFLLTIPLKNSSEYIHIGLRTERYDLDNKLWIYKNLKRTLEDIGYKSNIKTTSAKLDHNFKPYDIKEQQEKLALSNRVKLIA